MEAIIEFPAKINFLLGLNGSGKTNLLDAIYYLSATKSFSNAVDAHNIRHGEDHFLIKGLFNREGKNHEVTCQVQQGRKKVFQEDSKEYAKVSDHIGRYPIVLISPMDVDLVKESSEARRKFFDQMIAQIDLSYLNTLIAYHHILKQRNALLLMFAERNYTDPDMIELYDQQLAQTGQLLFEKRKVFVKEFLPIFNSSYNFLVNNSEEATLTYVSEVEDIVYNAGLKKSFKRDLQIQRTTFGIHKDDYAFGFAHGQLKRLGSQGQQKSFLVAVKLAQFEVIKAHNKFSPILLLDDIFDKLDDHRVARLLTAVGDRDHGQLFITDAAPERTNSLIAQLGIDGQVFSVDQGVILS